MEVENTRQRRQRTGTYTIIALYLSEIVSVNIRWHAFTKHGCPESNDVSQGLSYLQIFINCACCLLILWATYQRRFGIKVKMTTAMLFLGIIVTDIADCWRVPVGDGVVQLLIDLFGYVALIRFWFSEKSKAGEEATGYDEYKCDCDCLPEQCWPSLRNIVNNLCCRISETRFLCILHVLFTVSVITLL
jgi:hypothetical protein